MAKEIGKLKIELQRAQRDHKEATQLYISFKKKYTDKKAALIQRNHNLAAANKDIARANLRTEAADQKAKQLADQLKQAQKNTVACSGKAAKAKSTEIDDTDKWKIKLAKQKAHCDAINEQLNDKLANVAKTVKISIALSNKSRKDAMEDKLAEQRAKATLAKVKKQSDIDVAKRKNENEKHFEKNGVLQRKIQIMKDEQEAAAEQAGRRGGVYGMKTSRYAFDALRTTLKSYKKDHRILNDALKKCQRSGKMSGANAKSYRSEIAALQKQAKGVLDMTFRQQSGRRTGGSERRRKAKGSSSKSIRRTARKMALLRKRAARHHRAAMSALRRVRAEAKIKRSRFELGDEEKEGDDDLLAAPLWGSSEVRDLAWL